MAQFHVPLDKWHKTFRLIPSEKPASEIAVRTCPTGPGLLQTPLGYVLCTIPRPIHLGIAQIPQFFISLLLILQAAARRGLLAKLSRMHKRVPQRPPHRCTSGRGMASRLVLQLMADSPALDRFPLLAVSFSLLSTVSLIRLPLRLAVFEIRLPLPLAILPTPPVFYG